MKKFLLVFTILMIVPFFALLSQNEDMSLIIKKQLNQKGLKKIRRVEKFLLAFKNEKNEAYKLESSSQKKATRKEISASRDFGKANKIAYKVYREDLQKFTNIDQNDSAKAIKKKLLRAKRLMKQANNKREAALKLNVADDEYSLLKHADELETKAFNNIYAVYAILLKNTGKRPEIPNNNKIVSGNKDSGLVVNKITPIENNTNIQTVDSSKTDVNQTISSENNASNNKGTVLDENINSKVYFIIQVAAAQSELSVEQLKKNYQINENINVDKEGEWYKYSINRKFVDYNEAINYKTNLKMKGTMIIAFKNGKKVSIDEALKKDEIVEVPVKKIENKTTNNIPQENNGNITYRLQIGFSTKPLSMSEVGEFNNGGKEVYTIDCGSWFIYAVGDFDSELSALNFKRLKKMADAEVVKFRNGKVIDD
jgi:hypothetical protein